jgi:predicted MFS family arabinose efflux permease
MRNKQQTILFSANLILFFTGTGLFPLLPLYAGRFEASQTMIGIFLAALSGMNAVGALLASRLLARFSAKQLFIAAAAVGVPALFILAQASVFWLAMAAGVTLWFSGGFVSALLNVLTGLSAEGEARGRAFSMLFLASSVATVLGGTSVGALVSWLGYASTFMILAVIWGLIPVLGLFLANVEAAKTETATSAAPATALGRPFNLLLVSFLAVTAAVQMGNLMALLGMQAARFSPMAISSTTVVSGLASIPMALYAGSLSKRIGRQRLLLLSYLLVILTVIFLTGAAHLWHFSTGITLLLLAMTLVRPAVMALASDLLESRALQRGLPLLEAGVMGVGVASSAVTGYLLETFGPMSIGFLAALLAVIGGGALVQLFVGEGGRPFSLPGLHLFSRT